MRVVGDSGNIAKESGLALQGFSFGIVLSLLSMLSFRLAGFQASLIFVPLMAVFFWPREASRGLSSGFIFSLGLIVDFLSAGPPGLWAIIYLLCYGILRPDNRGTERHLRRLWLAYAGWCGLVAILIVLMGWIFIDGRTAVTATLSQVVISLVIFPFIYALYQAAHFFSEDADSPRFSL